MSIESLRLKAVVMAITGLILATVKFPVLANFIGVRLNMSTVHFNTTMHIAELVLTDEGLLPKEEDAPKPPATEATAVEAMIGEHSTEQKLQDMLDKMPGDDSTEQKLQHMLNKELAVGKTKPTDKKHKKQESSKEKYTVTITGVTRSTSGNDNAQQVRVGSGKNSTVVGEVSVKADMQGGGQEQTGSDNSQGINFGGIR